MVKAATQHIIAIQHIIIMITNFEKLLKRRDAFFKYAFSDSIVQKKYGNQKDIFYSYWQSYISLHLIIAHQKKEALKYYIESLKMNPTSFFSKRSLAITKNLLLN